MNARVSKKSVLLIGPMSEPPITGGIATGINMMLDSGLRKKYNFIFFNRAKQRLAKGSIIQGMKRQWIIITELISLIRKHRPYIVHVKTSSYMNLFTSGFYIFIAKCFSRKTILQIHGGGFASWYNDSSRAQKFLIRTTLHLPDRIFALSSFWGQFLAKLTPRTKIAIVPNGVRVNDFKVKENKVDSTTHVTERTRILFIGAPSIKANVEKGIYDVLKGFQYVCESEKEVLLMVAGFEDSLNNSEIVDLMKEHQFKENIQFLGIICGQSKVQAFRKADIFVLPSYYENMPNTILEAMAAGLPVISSAVGAIPELIEEGVNGFLIQPGDYRKLSEKMIQLLESPDLRWRMGENNRTKVKSSYDFEIIAEMIDKEYCELIQR